MKKTKDSQNKEINLKNQHSELDSANNRCYNLHCERKKQQKLKLQVEK